MTQSPKLIEKAFVVVQPGILSLLQDLGRFGHHHIGITNGGPLDKLSFNWANRLLDNKPNDCVIEASFGGLVLRAEIDTQIAVTGGDGELTINQTVVPKWQTHAINKGDSISFGFAKTTQRQYLAVKGGFKVESSFGSCSTVVREKIGGLNGNALKANDTLPCLSSTNKTVPHTSVDLADRPPYLTSKKEEDITLRVILGYQQDAFSNIQKARFFNNEFKVSDKCDRMGFRLTGPEIKPDINSMLSEGICYGAVQIPSDGQPIILLNDRQTIGGYPKIGSIFSLDIPKLTQRLPGTSVYFEPLNIDDAQCELHLANYRYESTPLKK